MTKFRNITEDGGPLMVGEQFRCMEAVSHMEAIGQEKLFEWHCRELK